MAKKKVIKDVEAEEVKTKKAKKEKEEVEEIVPEVEDVEEEVELDEEEEEEETESKKEKKEKKEKVSKEKKPGYLSLVHREMKKVVWPSAGDVFKYSLAVIIFCVVLIAFFIGIDALSSLIKGLFS